MFIFSVVRLMSSKLEVNLREYKELIETIAKVEYQKLSAAHLIDYLELVNIGTQTLYNLFKKSDPGQFNTSYLTTAIKWAIRNEIRRRYRWYSLRNNPSQEEQEDLRCAVYKTILSIDEMAEAENPTQVKADTQTPEQMVEFKEMKSEILEAIEKLPAREKELIEKKFFSEKKLKDLSEEFNLSPSRVSRIIQSGLNKIKKELSKNEEKRSFW